MAFLRDIRAGLSHSIFNARTIELHSPHILKRWDAICNAPPAVPHTRLFLIQPMRPRAQALTLRRRDTVAGAGGPSLTRSPARAPSAFRGRRGPTR